jgi:5-methylcytosine-specific restriction endonuclease McrA
MEQTLLLNATYEPLRVVHWQKAITLWCQGKVEIVAHYDREVRSVSFSIKLPSVIRCCAVFACAGRPSTSRFRARTSTLETTIPASTAATPLRLLIDVRSRYSGRPGGRKDWENIVTCCITCNRKKGGRTPDQAGMRLVPSSERPDKAPAVRITFGLRNAPESWRDYVYWNVKLDDES